MAEKREGTRRSAWRAPGGARPATRRRSADATRRHRGATMARTPGFFAEGCREIGRKLRRMTLRRRLAAKDGERRQALMRLGQAAWQSKADLSAWPELRGRLEELDARAGDLSDTTRK